MKVARLVLAATAARDLPPPCAEEHQSDMEEARHDTCFGTGAWPLLAFDTVSLIKSALADDKAGWVKKSAAVQEFWSASLMLVWTLDATFVHQAPEAGNDRIEHHAEQWRARYFAALKRLRQAGLPLVADEERGAELYVNLRRRWHPLIAALAPAMAYSMDEIDPAISRPEEAARRPPFQERLRSV